MSSACYFSVIAPPTANNKYSSCHNHHSIHMKFSLSGLHVIHNKMLVWCMFFFAQCLIVTAQSHVNLCPANSEHSSDCHINLCIDPFVANTVKNKKIFRKNTGSEPTD